MQGFPNFFVYNPFLIIKNYCSPFVSLMLKFKKILCTIIVTQTKKADKQQYLLLINNNNKLFNEMYGSAYSCTISQTLAQCLLVLVSVFDICTIDVKVEKVDSYETNERVKHKI